jgi:glycosyltransferase involved in cell wall biosynthesis
MSVYCSVAATLRGIPHVCTMHGNFNMLNVWRRRAALWLAFRLSRTVVAVSEATKGHLIEKMGLPPGKVRAILNGISYTAGERERVRRELGIGDDELMVLALGRLIVLKGHRVLLRAMERLDQSGVPRNWHVVIAGHGRLESELKRQAGDAGLTGRAHILGYRKDVSDLLAASDIFVMPSLWEGLPVALLEAMFAGKPVLASRCFGIPEVIEDGVHGLLVPPGDEILLANGLRRLLTEPELRSRLAAAGRERVAEGFSAAVMVDRYEEAYGIR